MSEERSATHEVEDSAPTTQTNRGANRGRASRGRGGTQRGARPSQTQPGTPRSNKSETSSTKSTPGFSEGNNVLQSYGLSVSGRKERILSPFKADKFFHFVEQSWQQLVRLKPHLSERFSLAEFKHASALQLYHRIESVKFEALGIKPSAPTRIPLPRSTRVFQPIWSVLANIGTVDDEELRALYIPDGILPKTEDLTDPEDVENLLACTLYDWHSSWHDVLNARASRKEYQTRDGFTPITVSNEIPVPDKAKLLSDISEARRILSNSERDARNTKQFRIVDGWLYKLPNKTTSPKGKEKEADTASITSEPDTDISDDVLKKTARLWSPDQARKKLDNLMNDARRAKAQAIAPKFDVSYKIEAYTISDGTIESDPGAYGSRLHWDPQLWLEYEQFVEIVTPIALFSLSMPAESVGTYAWLLPVEKRDDDDSSVSARLPKASIAPVTWILSLLLQSSTLPLERRSTFYVETDRLQNVLGLRQRYIRAAIKDPSAVEQYGTY